MKLLFEEESLVFKHWTRLELVDFPYASIDSEAIELESVEGRVLNRVVVTFDFGVDPEESRGNWVYDFEIDPLEVKVTSCSDELVLELYQEDLEEMILDEMRHGLEIDPAELDVDIE